MKHKVQRVRVGKKSGLRSRLIKLGACGVTWKASPRHETSPSSRFKDFGSVFRNLKSQKLSQRIFFKKSTNPFTIT